MIWSPVQLYLYLLALKGTHIRFISWDHPLILHVFYPVFRPGFPLGGHWESFFWTCFYVHTVKIMEFFVLFCGSHQIGFRISSGSTVLSSMCNLLLDQSSCKLPVNFIGAGTNAYYRYTRTISVKVTWKSLNDSPPRMRSVCTICGTKNGGVADCRNLYAELRLKELWISLKVHNAALLAVRWLRQKTEDT